MTTTDVDDLYHAIPDAIEAFEAIMRHCPSAYHMALVHQMSPVKIVNTMIDAAPLLPTGPGYPAIDVIIEQMRRPEFVTYVGGRMGAV